MTHSSIVYGIVMLIAGLGIPVMAALNSHLGQKLQSPEIAVSILFSVGLAIALLVAMFTSELPSVAMLFSVPWYLYCGGILVMFYLFSITWIAPRFGVSNSVSFVLLGQVIAMVFIDHFGFTGAKQFSMSTDRIIGLVLIVCGVFIAVKAPVNADVNLMYEGVVYKDKMYEDHESVNLNQESKK
jgi:transporter family-2 protein